MTANEILSIAIAELGTKESPANSNRVKYNTWYYGKTVSGSAYPWCMVFVQWVFCQAGAKSLLPAVTASCTQLMNAAKAKGLWVTSDYRPGDILIYDWSGDRIPDHTGIFEKRISSSAFYAIEGNTSIGNDSNGGAVMRRSRSTASVLGAVRPKYTTVSQTTTSVKQEDDNMMTDQQIYEAVIRYSASLTMPASLQAELQEAVSMGITDGSNPMKLIPRYQAAIMAKRAVQAARK